jgi:Ni/Co efflux regulator RcnB
MKTRRWMRGCATAVLVLAFPFAQGRALAQEREHDREHDNDRDRDRDRRHFDDHDRQSAQEWYREHRDHLPEGLRERDRLSAAFESRLRTGEVLDLDLRHRIHPVPHELLEHLPPCPEHYRYVIIGGHICLIDEGYHLQDVIHFELNL